MAFPAFKQISSSSVFTPDFNEKIRKRYPAGWDRVFCLQKKPCGRKRRNGPNGASTPPKAIREHASASSSHLASSQQGFTVIFDREPSITPPMQAWPAMEEKEEEGRDQDFLTELKRSLLESQWALTDELHHIIPSKIKDAGGNSSLPLPLPSRRLSARQRRILARNFENSSSTMPPPSPLLPRFDVMSTSSAPLSPRDGKGKSPSILEALETVNTLGFMRGIGKRELLTKEEEIILSKKMKVGQNLRAARKKLSDTLGYEPSNELWAKSVKLSLREVQAKLMEADRARDYMFISNLRLVVSVANKYSNLGVNLADLIQEGAVGLLRGLQKFDHKKGFKLSTYVHWWIRQGVTQALTQHSKTLRVPAYMHGKLSLLNRTVARFRKEGTPVLVKSLSNALNMPDEIVSVALKATKKTISLDKPKIWSNSNPEEDSMHNYVADPCTENNPWDVVDRMSLWEDLDALLASTLCKREQDIVRLYYGFDSASGQGVSLQKIGHRIGISRERTRQIQGCALRKLGVAGQQVDLGVPLTY